jgi:hypothetical protein
VSAYGLEPVSSTRFEGLRLCHAAAAPSPSLRPSLVALRTPQSFDMWPSIRHVGLPDPTMASSFPSSPSWFSSDHRPPKLSPWVHPLARFPSPTESLASLPARRLPAPSTFLGVSCPIAAQPAESTYTVPGFRQAPRRGHPKPTSFRPRRFSRPRRLPPPLTSQVCFTPQPRPGFALQGLPLG